MPTYESNGSLTTVEKSFSSAQTPDLSNLVYTLNGQSVSVDVVGSPGTASEETLTVTLDGSTSYDLTWNSAHSDFEVVFNLSTADTSQTPTVDDLTLVGEPNAPGNLTVTEVTDTPSVALSWSDVATEDEYRVYRATSPGSTLADYTQIDTVAADSTTYTDTTVSLGTRYYYRVTAYNTSTGESEPSRERRAEVTDPFTNTITWDSEREWNYGAFTDTQTTGSGGVQLDVGEIDTFNYSIDVDDSVSGLIEIRDADTNTVLYSDSVSLGPGTASGSYTVDTLQHSTLEFYAEVDDNNANGAGSAAISDETATTLASVSSGVSGTGVFTDSATNEYGYETTGTYQTDTWDYTNTTTASKLTTSVSYSESGQSINVDIVSASGAGTTTVTLDGGTNEYLVEVPADDRYYLTATLNRGSSGDLTPVLETATLEAHTSTGDTLQVDAVNGVDVDLSWTGVPVADGYQILRATNPGTTPGDYTPLATTTNTSYTDSSGDAGVDYYYRVRAQYTGE